MSLLNMFGFGKRKKEDYIEKMFSEQQKQIEKQIKAGIRNPDGSLKNQPKYPRMMHTLRPIDFNDPIDQEIMRQFRIAYVCMCRFNYYIIENYGLNFTDYDAELKEINNYYNERIFPWTEEIGFTKGTAPQEHPVDLYGLKYEQVYACEAECYEENIIPHLDELGFDTPTDLATIKKSNPGYFDRIVGLRLEPEEGMKFLKAFASDPTRGFYPVVHRKNDKSEIAEVRIAVNIKDFAQSLKRRVSTYQGKSDGFYYGLNDIALYPVCFNVLNAEDYSYPVSPSIKLEVYTTDCYSVDEVCSRKFILTPNSTDEEYMYAAATFASMMGYGIRETGQAYLTTHPDPFNKGYDKNDPDKEEVDR